MSLRRLPLSKTGSDIGLCTVEEVPDLDVVEFVCQCISKLCVGWGGVGWGGEEREGEKGLATSCIFCKLQ